MSCVLRRGLQVTNKYKRLLLSSSAPSSISSTERRIDLSSPECNITSTIADRIGVNLHRQEKHPLHIIHRKICDYWGDSFTVYDDLSPIVSTNHAFDLLRIPADHVSRSVSDTYYVNSTTVLRPHTSAHQVELLRRPEMKRFLVTGDVYRRDEIDRSHYPIFHQMEGVKLLDLNDHHPNLTVEDANQVIEKDLKTGLEGLASHLFGPVEMRWNDEYFPFTHPSFELEILYDNEWMEVLGCGVIHPDILANAGRPNERGWAFGLGLERLAMILFGIPDIRLFWSSDQRFHQQFQSGQLIKFQPYSKYPPCWKDMSFWLGDQFHVNDLHEIVRSVAGDWVEEVKLMDAFTHPKTNRTSHCYRIVYRSMDRNLTNEEIDALQESVRVETVKHMGVELR
jgi:phenylalanyl-tRNA synthetase alpha chain